MEIKITLSHDDFAALVRGNAVTVAAFDDDRGNRTKYPVRIILSDIGFQTMTAEVNAARRGQ
jgi:hypothetical protein